MSLSRCGVGISARAIRRRPFGTPGPALFFVLREREGQVEEMVGQARETGEPRSVSPVGHVRTKCVSHCVYCGECFSGDSAFDSHVVRGEHEWPGDLKRLVAKTHSGTCDLGVPGVTRANVTVWALAGWDKARERAA